MGWKWKTAPVYPGDPWDLGDTYYTPGTRDKGIIYSRDLIPNEDINRINKQTGSRANTNYLIRPYGQSSWKPKVNSNQKKSSTSTGKPRTSTPSATGKPKTAPKAPASNSQINKSRGIWNYNGVSQADVANAYKTGDFSKVGSYLSQHKDLASYLNNIYSKRGGNQFLVNPQLKLNLGYDPSQNNQLVNLKFKQGGQMYKYAAGAQMVQPQQASGQQGIEQQAMALVQAAMQGDQKANQTIQKIMQAAQQGNQQAAQVAQLLKNIVQQMKGSRKARLGAKLDYIKQSIGECPEGQEVVYFKKGGEICKVCAGKKMQNGGKSDPIKDFKKKKDVTKQTYQRNPYTRGKSAKEIAEMQRRNRQEAGAGKGENDANVAPWNYKKKR